MAASRCNKVIKNYGQTLLDQDLRDAQNIVASFLLGFFIKNLDKPGLPSKDAFPSVSKLKEDLDSLIDGGFKSKAR